MTTATTQLADCDIQIERALAKHADGQIAKGSMFDRLLLFWRWLQAGRCKIRDIRGEIIALEPNLAQRMLFAKMLAQADAGMPIRGVILKARKPGVSTFIQALTFFVCAHYENQIALMLAHDSASTLDIFDIGHRIADRYPLVANDPTVYAIRFPETESRYRCRTAGGEGIGAGGTPSLLHLSEVALWPHTHKQETEATATSAVPPVAESAIFWESTARGRELFYERFQAAERGETRSFALFIPWFLGELWQVPAPIDFERTEEEDTLARLASTYGITMSDDQLEWKRGEEIRLGEGLFRQEFPATAEEAVQGMRGLVLPGLRECVIDELPFDAANVSDPQARGGGIDHGYHDPTAIITLVEVDQVAYVVDVYRVSGGLAEDHVKGLCVGHTYYCDPSGTAAREEMIAALRRLNGQGVRLLPAPRRAQGSQLNYVNAEFQLIRTRIVTGRLKILADHAEQIVSEADNLFWNTATGLPNMVRGDAWGHFDCLDGLRYGLMGFEAAVEPPRMTRKPLTLTRRQAWRNI